jgi:hypothetical protein
VDRTDQWEFIHELSGPENKNNIRTDTKNFSLVSKVADKILMA